MLVALEESQSRLSEAQWYRVEGALGAGEAEQRLVIEAQRQPEAFRAELDTEYETGTVSVEIIRAHATTWVRADPEYWLSLGYDEGSAARSEGLFVVFEPAAGDALWARHDPTAVLEYVQDLEAEDLELAPEEGDGSRVRVAAGALLDDGDEVALDVPPAGSDAPLRVHLGSGRGSSLLEFTELAEEPDIRRPSHAEVLSSDGEEPSRNGGSNG